MYRIEMKRQSFTLWPGDTRFQSIVAAAVTALASAARRHATTCLELGHAFTFGSASPEYEAFTLLLELPDAKQKRKQKP